MVQKRLHKNFGRCATFMEPNAITGTYYFDRSPCARQLLSKLVPPAHHYLALQVLYQQIEAS
jgi:hypothetical protein